MCRLAACCHCEPDLKRKGTRNSAMKKVLLLAAVSEAATGLALLIAPSLVGRLLLGAELVGASIPVARVTGIALIALGVSCLPRSLRGRLGQALVGMLTYSLLVTLYLLYLGVRGEWGRAAAIARRGGACRPNDAPCSVVVQRGKSRLAGQSGAAGK